jgi:hypothetical protein
MSSADSAENIYVTGNASAYSVGSGTHTVTYSRAANLVTANLGDGGERGRAQ